MNLLDFLIDQDAERIIDGDERSAFVITQADVDEIVHMLGNSFRPYGPSEPQYKNQLLGRPFYIVEQGVPQSSRHGAIYSPRARESLL